MGHTVGDGIIVAALAAAFVTYLYLRHIERHAPDVEKRLAGWRELNKSWVERARQEGPPEHGRSKG